MNPNRGSLKSCIGLTAGLAAALSLVSCGEDSGPTESGPSDTWQWIAEADSTYTAFSDVVTTMDGHVVAVGSTTETGMGAQALVVKFTPGGEVVWNRKVGGPGNETPRRAIALSDGGYGMAGIASGYGDGSPQGLIMVLNADGSLRWERVYDRSDYNSLSGLAESPNGGFLAIGTLNEDVAGTDWHILRVNADGEPIWETTFGSPGVDDEGRDVALLANGEYGVVGMRSTTVNDVEVRGLAVLSVSDSGNVTILNQIDVDIDIEVVVAGPDSGLVAAGHVGPPDGLSNRGMVYTHSEERGVRWWALSASDSGQFFDVTATPSGTYMAVGVVQKLGTVNQAWMAEANYEPSGFLWDRTFGNDAVSYSAYGVTADPRGGFIVAGQCLAAGSPTRAWLFRTDEQGNTDAPPGAP